MQYCLPNLPVCLCQSFHSSSILILSYEINRKEIHTCTPIGSYGCRHEKPYCSKCFPHPIQPSRTPQYNALLGRWQYYCPGPEHRNVVPHSPVRNNQNLTCPPIVERDKQRNGFEWNYNLIVSYFVACFLSLVTCHVPHTFALVTSKRFPIWSPMGFYNQRCGGRVWRLLNKTQYIRYYIHLWRWL